MVFVCGFPNIISISFFEIRQSIVIHKKTEFLSYSRTWLDIRRIFENGLLQKEIIITINEISLVPMNCIVPWSNQITNFISNEDIKCRRTLYLNNHGVSCELQVFGLSNFFEFADLFCAFFSLLHWYNMMKLKGLFLDIKLYKI